VTIRKDSFVKGALIMSMGLGVTKVLGAAYRIFLPRVLEAEGVGLFNMAYPVYAVVLVLSTAGIPLAISKLVAERIAQGNGAAAFRTFRVALLMLLVLGLGFSTVLFLSAGFVSHSIARDPRAYYAVASISPAIVFVAVMSAMRGLFQGLQRMGPPSASLAIEQFVRVTTIFALGYFLLPWGVKYAAAGAAFGAVTGGAAALVYLAYVYWRESPSLQALYRSDGPREDGTSAIEVAKQILYLSIPISLGSLIFPVMQNIDLILVPWALHRVGYATSDATEMYGILSGLVVPVVSAVTVFTAALAYSLVPAISEAAALRSWGAVRSRTMTALRMALLISLPAAAGAYVLARPICGLLFTVPEAGEPLAVMAAGMVFLGLQHTTTGVLQGLGRVDIPVRNLAIGALFKLGATWILTPLPAFGIKGAALGSVLAFLVASTLNLRDVHRIVGLRLDLGGMVLKPLFSVLFMSVGVLAVYRFGVGAFGSSNLATALAVPAGVVLYGFVLLVIGGIRERDLELVPRFGGPLAGLLRRMGLLRK